MFSAYCLIKFYICTKFWEVSNRVSELFSGKKIFTLTFTKETSSVKFVSGVTVFVFCTSSDKLYICTKLRENISKSLTVIAQTRFSH